MDHSLDSHTRHKRPTPASFLQRQSVNYRSSNGQLLDYFEFSVARMEVASGRGCAGVASLCLPQVERWRALLLAAATELETPINASPLFAQPVPPPSHPSLPLPCHTERSSHKIFHHSPSHSKHIEQLLILFRSQTQRYQDNPSSLPI